MYIALQLKQCMSILERTHTGENPFKCKLCTQVCSQKFALKEHVFPKHVKQKSVKGNYSEQTFYCTSNKSRHICLVYKFKKGK